LGYGYGAIWSISAFRFGLGQSVGWRFPVLIGDNGFVDILLSIGIVGLIPFLGVFIQTWVRSIKHAINYRTQINFFPVLIMVFALMANISYSLFLETESFVWLLMITVLFIPNSTDNLPQI
jgi:O-antigen ligase